MKSVFKILCVLTIVSVSNWNAFSRVREGEAVEDNVKRLIADRLKIGISDIKEHSTLQTLGADDVDAVLIVTDAQYFFNIDYDVEVSKKLSKRTVKVSELIEKTVTEVYP